MVIVARNLSSGFTRDKIGTKQRFCAKLKENFILAYSIKRLICDVKNSQLGNDLPISVNERVISPYCENFILTKLRICEVPRKQNPRDNFRIYSTIANEDGIDKIPRSLISDLVAL